MADAKSYISTSPVIPLPSGPYYSCLTFSRSGRHPHVPCVLRHSCNEDKRLALRQFTQPWTHAIRRTIGDPVDQHPPSVARRSPKGIRRTTGPLSMVNGNEMKDRPLCY